MNHTTTKSDNRYRLAIGLAAAFSIAAFLTPFAFFGLPASANEFGDSFGLANAVVSLCAFAVLVYTINLQRVDLRVQHDALALQREEMQRMQQVQLLSLRAELTSRIPGKTSDGRGLDDDELISFYCDLIDNEIEKLLRELQPPVEAIGAIFRTVHYLNSAIRSEEPLEIGLHLRSAARWSDLLKDANFKSLYEDGNAKTKDMLATTWISVEALEQRLVETGNVEKTHEAIRKITSVLLDTARAFIPVEADLNPSHRMKPNFSPECREILDAVGPREDAMQSEPDR